VPAESPRFDDGLKRRPATEFVSLLVFRPLAYLLVRLLWRTPVRPEHLVLTHGLLGLAAAGLLAENHYPAAAFVLQLVTLLDGADGQLARLRGQVSQLGRYLDTEVDFLVHLGLFAVLAKVCGGGPALLGLVFLTFVLSLDYNLVAAHYADDDRPPPAGGLAEEVLAFVYTVLFAWQDGFIRRLERRLNPPPRWFYLLLANLGRSTQFAILGLFLLAGHPCGYLVFLAVTTGVVFLVYAIRIWRSIRFPR